MTRKQFLSMAAGLCAGCKFADRANAAGIAHGEVDAGPAANYAKDGVYDRFARKGFFIVRKGGKLFALSSVCTHRRCQLNIEGDQSFYCDCHGSTFDPGGKVTHGPARRNLPVLPLARNAAGHLVVTLT